MTPDSYAALGLEWVRGGASIVTGWWDVGPADIAGLADVAVIEREEGWVLGVGC